MESILGKLNDCLQREFDETFTIEARRQLPSYLLYEAEERRLRLHEQVHYQFEDQLEDQFSPDLGV